MIASALCIVHCLLLPVAVALLPAFSHFLDLPEGVHLTLFVFAAPISAYAMLTGARRHGLWLPGALALAGLVLLGLGALGGLPLLMETGATVVGSLLMIAGHAINLRSRRAAHVS